MTRLILSLSILILIAVFAAKASSLDEKQTATKIAPQYLSFSSKLVPAEVPFVVHCTKQQIKVDWEYARRCFYVNVKYGYDMFEGAVRELLHTDYDQLEALGLRKLHEQYSELYKALTQPSSPPQKPAIQADSNIVRGASSSSTASVNDAEGNNYDSDASTPRADASTLRQRHTSANAANATVAVK